LFKVADVLISDYSACIADYSILERPVICFAYDYEDYKATRGLYIDFSKEMPNGIFETEDKVISHILTMDYDAECVKTRDMIKNKFTYLGGHATEMCVDKLFGTK
jgi:CDP-glycerol glycerophosphotransferase